MSTLKTNNESTSHLIKTAHKILSFTDTIYFMKIEAYPYKQDARTSKRFTCLILYDFLIYVLIILKPNTLGNEVSKNVLRKFQLTFIDTKWWYDKKTVF